MAKTLYILSIFLIILSGNLFSQKKDMHVVKARVVHGDTIPHIELREIVILPPRVFTSTRELNRYKKLVRNVKKVYPYAKLANMKLTEINNHLATIESEKEKKKYINQADKELKNEFEEELKSMTVSQGRILIKLIDRETGDTSYELVKELKGSFTAFMYQSLASLFGSSLKKEYDPNGEDKLIEEIIIRIENGQL